jgi:hypothetical protein
MAARGLKTKTRTPKYKPAVAMKQMTTVKEKPSADEATETICGELEAAAAKESNGSEEDAVALLTDNDWVGAQIDELIDSFELDDGIKTKLVARIRKKYTADGE